MTTALSIVIPGTLPPAPRPRARVMGKMASVYTPSRGAYAVWKKMARAQMQNAIRATDAWPTKGEPLSVTLRIVLPLAKSHHRKTKPVKQMWCQSQRAGDIDNLAKGPLDAANGVLWDDDRNVVELMVTKVVAAQGEEPKVHMIIHRMGDLV